MGKQYIDTLSETNARNFSKECILHMIIPTQCCKRFMSVQTAPHLKQKSYVCIYYQYAITKNIYIMSMQKITCGHFTSLEILRTVIFHEKGYKDQLMEDKQLQKSLKINSIAFRCFTGGCQFLVL